MVYLRNSKYPDQPAWFISGTANILISLHGLSQEEQMSWSVCMVDIRNNKCPDQSVWFISGTANILVSLYGWYQMLCYWKCNEQALWGVWSVPLLCAHGINRYFWWNKHIFVARQRPLLNWIFAGLSGSLGFTCCPKDTFWLFSQCYIEPI